MTEIELCFYDRLDTEIDDRAHEICKELDLLYKSSYELFVSDGKVAIDIINYEGICVDHLIMTFKQFCSNNYLEEAKKIRQEDIERKERAAAEAKAEQKAAEMQKRRQLYEELKREFE